MRSATDVDDLSYTNLIFYVVRFMKDWSNDMQIQLMLAADIRSKALTRCENRHMKDEYILCK